jgi:hypothetical protein
LSLIAETVSGEILWGVVGSAGQKKLRRRTPMRYGRITAALVAASIAALIAVSAALAASPQKIYADYANNGRIDGTYSNSDLQRALTSAVVQQYGHGQTQGLKPAVKTKITKNTTTGTKTSKPTKAQGALAAPPVKTESGGLPFTGLDLGLITLGAISLLLFGAALRRFARHRA